MDGTTGEAVLNKIIDMAEQYYNCADSKLKLIQAVD